MYLYYLNTLPEPRSSIPQPQPRGFLAVAQDCNTDIEIRVIKQMNRRE